MAFVNEYVSAEDVKKYGLEEINRQYRKSNVQPDWTIDRDIYLRWIHSGREEFADQHDFTLYWKGTLIFLRLKRKEGYVVARGGTDGPCSS